jgi:nucleoside-diphosphate-sugar epimerase
MAFMSALPSLVVGCGYLGLRVAQRWLAEGRPVVALTRGRAEELRVRGIEPILGDVLDPRSLKQLPEVGSVVYAVGLDRSAGREMREVYVNGLANVLQELRSSGPFVYISSTSVYGQTDGEWVGEDSPTEPLEGSGRVVREAERVLRQHRPEAIILRFAGIYGPKRILRQQALLNGEPLVGDAEKWLNLIHVDDGSRAVLAAESQGSRGGTYLIADDEPVRRREFYTYSAEILKAPPAKFQMPELPTREPNRRIRNARAKRELGFVPTYANYREGLRASLPIAGETCSE